MKQPAFQFYPGDWLRDSVAGCSLEAQGLWLRMMFIMHDAERRGYLAQNGLPIPPESIARRCGCTPAQYMTLLAELDSASVPSRTSNETIFNRRMVRDEQERQAGAKRTAKFRANGGGDPARWSALRVPILERDQYICAYCGKKASTVDHVNPKSKGGTEEDDNLVACCKGCNMKKSNRTPEEAKMGFCASYTHARNTSITPLSLASSSSVSVSTSVSTSNKSNSKNTCPAASAAPAPVVCLPLIGNSEHPVTQEQVTEWAELYPAVDVPQQLRNMRGWLLGNPTHRKTESGIGRFVVRWLQKTQDQGPQQSKKLNRYDEQRKAIERVFAETD